MFSFNFPPLRGQHKIGLRFVCNLNLKYTDDILGIRASLFGELSIPSRGGRYKRLLCVLCRLLPAVLVAILNRFRK